MKYKLLSFFSIIALSTQCLLHAADTLVVDHLKVSAPYTIKAPYLTDSTDVFGKGWEFSDKVMQKAEFSIQNENFAKVKIIVSGPKEYKVFIDNQEGAEQNLVPARHQIFVETKRKIGEADSLHVSVESQGHIIINPEGKQPYTLSTLMYGERMGGVNISPDGRYLVLDKSYTKTDGKPTWTKYLIDLKTRHRTILTDFRQWTSKGHSYISAMNTHDMKTFYAIVDAETGQSRPLMTDPLNQSGYFLPGEKQMLVHKSTDGPKEDEEVFQVLTPDDRQAGWRNRTNITLMDVSSGNVRTVTAGQHNVNATVSPDGNKVLLHIYSDNITRRPFTFMSAVVLDLTTMKADTLFENDGFAGQGQWSPDGTFLVFSGSPEAFNGVGNRTPEGMTASMIHQGLYRLNLDTKQVEPLTADFTPNVSSWKWSSVDGMIYALCENRDNQDIFCINPKTGETHRLPLTERYVLRFDLAEQSPLLTYYGQGHSNSDRLYIYNLKNGKESLIEDLDTVRMRDIELGKFGEWNFQAERGDTIYGRYYLPPHFDANKQYPMLVYYYGGCSPVGRYLDSYYSFHGWAAMGYVVYVIQPSGCTGFGQEFAARHVNAYGDYTADDIIQGTKKFCTEHPFVNKKKIGCLGASYGGFMTQYLQTQTDIFAAAMSHAGISDPTSYWGYGYWGYSYSAISAANSYPWNNRELFTDHAPLTLADRIHTPILFMHGSDDTNVPINESIQLFTALKILGRECAFVTVKGQNHHILDYSKRIKSQHTIYAWFERWLKDDPTWWNTMYPEKNL